MAHQGKIACHFPNAGNPNHDVYGIKFLPAGASSSNDLLTIDKVYYLSPSDITAIKALSTMDEKLAYLRSTNPTHRVWELVQLVAGNQNVAIEYYNDTEDVTVQHIGIFTADIPDSTTQCIKIIHESGVVLAQINVDSVSSQTTKYNLQGYLRTATVNNIVFHKNQKYYIMYTDNRSTSDYYPAYFANMPGNYKAFKNRDSKNIGDLNSCAPYLGWITDLDDFVDASEDTILVWNGDSSILNIGTVYIRNNTCQGTYVGKIGNAESLNEALLNQILNLNTDDIFYWGGWNYSPSNVDTLLMNQLHKRNSTYLKSNYIGIISTRNELLDSQYSVGQYGITGTTIWRKKDNVVVDDTLNFDDYSGLQVPAAVLIQKSYNATANKKVMTYGSYDGSQKNGYIYTLKYGFSYDFTIDQNDQLHGYTISNPPSSWVINRIYYLEEQGNYPGATWAPVGLSYYYEDSQGNPKFGQVSVYSDTLPDVFNIDTQSALDVTEEISLANTIDIIGQVNTLVKTSYTGSYISNDCRNTTVSNTAKYYLEINGREV